MKLKLIFVFLLLAILVTNPYKASAQIMGDPIFKRISLYTGAGAVLGAAVGVLFWATDPLSPSNDFDKAVYFGFGVGAIAGLGFGFYQAYQKTVPPIQKEVNEDIIYYGYNKSDSKSIIINSLLAEQKKNSLNNDYNFLSYALNDVDRVIKYKKYSNLIPLYNYSISY